MSPSSHHRKTYNRSLYARSASLLITGGSLAVNVLLFLQVLAAWRSLRWVAGESGYSYDGADNDLLLGWGLVWGQSWRADGVRLVWGLLAVYFLAAIALCAVGLAGVIKNKPSLVRLYRSYEIASLVFLGLSTLVLGHLAVFGSSSSLWSIVSSLSDDSAGQPGLASAMCDELSRQPELMRNIIELGMGLVSLENCESWLEWALIGGVIGMVAILIVRIHLALAVSHYHGHLVRYEQQRLPINSHSLHPRPPFSPSHARTKSNSSRRSSRNDRSISIERRSGGQEIPQTIYLLPQASTSTSPLHPTTPQKEQEYFVQEPRSMTEDDNFLVYAPVPLSSLPANVARDIRARARGVVVVDDKASRRHHRHHSGLSLGPGEGVAGRISLPLGDGAL